METFLQPLFPLSIGQSFQSLPACRPSHQWIRPSRHNQNLTSMLIFWGLYPSFLPEEAGLISGVWPMYIFKWKDLLVTEWHNWRWWGISNRRRQEPEMDVVFITSVNFHCVIDFDLLHLAGNPAWLETNTRPQSSLEMINWIGKIVGNLSKTMKSFSLSFANDLKTNVPLLTYQEILCCCYQMASIKLNSFLYLGRIGKSTLVIPFKGVWPIYSGESPQGSFEHLLGKLFREQSNYY